VFETLVNLNTVTALGKLRYGFTWFLVDLAVSTVIFIALEQVFSLKKSQPVFRCEWLTDFNYFALNHLVLGFLLVPAAYIAQALLGLTGQLVFRLWVSQLPFPIALVLIVLLADVIQYWVHRLYHEVPLLWRFHAVHHSAKTLDWLSGSRQHLLELFLTRTCLLAPFVVLGFSPMVVNTFIVIGGLQAVFNHSNIDARLGWLSKILVTPNFHHWHHSIDPEAMGRNFAAHFSFLDRIFGTDLTAEGRWPTEYGLMGQGFPTEFGKQLVFPFTQKD